MPPDFLNSREDAILVWLAAIVLFALSKDFRGIGGSLLGVVRASVQPKVLLVFGSTLAYSAVMVYAASRVGMWHTSALKATIYWFLGTGIVLVGKAVTDGARNDRAFLRTALRRVIAATVITEFVVNVYALPFLVELICVFVILLFAGMQALVEHDPSYPQVTRRFIDGVLVAVGCLYLGYFAVRVLTDLDGFFSHKNLEDFVVGPALTLAVIPALVSWAWLSRREQQRFHRRFARPRETPV